MKSFFADSYALLAWLKGDPEYGRLFREATTYVTNVLNLLEVEYTMLRREVHPEEVDKAVVPFETRALGVDRPLLRHAARVRARMRADGLRCSYIDAIGYAHAQERELPFLTGDRAFRRMPGVHFLQETEP